MSMSPFLLGPPPRPLSAFIVLGGFSPQTGGKERTWSERACEGTAVKKERQEGEATATLPRMH